MTKKRPNLPSNILSIPKSEPERIPIPQEQQEQSLLLETVCLEDPGPIAVVRVVKPIISIKTEITFGGRVGFRLTGTHEDMKEAFEALMNDAPLGCRTLLDSLRLVRTMMFQAKTASQRSK